MQIRSLILGAILAAGLSTAGFAAQIGNSPPGFGLFDALGSPPAAQTLSNNDMLLFDDGFDGFHVINISAAGKGLSAPAIDVFDIAMTAKGFDDDPALFLGKKVGEKLFNIGALIDDGGGGELCAASLNLDLATAWHGFDTADPAAAALPCPAIASVT